MGQQDQHQHIEGEERHGQGKQSALPPFHPRLPAPREIRSFNVPVYSRTLNAAERRAFKDAARSGLYSILEMAEAFQVSRSLAYVLTYAALDPEEHAARQRRRQEARRSAAEATGSNSSIAGK